MQARDLSSWLNEGLQHYAAGEPARALEAWYRVLEAEPQHVAALEYVAFVRQTFRLDDVSNAAVGEPAPAQPAPPTTPVAVVPPSEDDGASVMPPPDGVPSTSSLPSPAPSPAPPPAPSPGPQTSPLPTTTAPPSSEALQTMRVAHLGAGGVPAEPPPPSTSSSSLQTVRVAALTDPLLVGKQPDAEANVPAIEVPRTLTPMPYGTARGLPPLPTPGLSSSTSTAEAMTAAAPEAAPVVVGPEASASAAAAAPLASEPAPAQALPNSMSPSQVQAAVLPSSQSKAMAMSWADEVGGESLSRPTPSLPSTPSQPAPPAWLSQPPVGLEASPVAPTPQAVVEAPTPVSAEPPPPAAQPTPEKGVEALSPTPPPERAIIAPEDGQVRSAVRFDEPWRNSSPVSIPSTPPEAPSSTTPLAPRPFQSAGQAAGPSLQSGPTTTAPAPWAGIAASTRAASVPPQDAPGAAVDDAEGFAVSLEDSAPQTPSPPAPVTPMAAGGSPFDAVPAAPRDAQPGLKAAEAGEAVEAVEAVDVAPAAGAEGAGPATPVDDISPWDAIDGPAATLDLDASEPERSPFEDLLQAATDAAPPPAPRDPFADVDDASVQPPTRVPSAPRPVVQPEPEPDALEQLMTGARELFELGDFSGSLELVEKVLEADPSHEGARAYLRRNESTLLGMYESKLGALTAIPRPLVPPDEVIWMNMHHRAGFILSQVDGSLTYEDIVDVSGMDRFDTMRILADLVTQGIIG